MAIGLLTVGSVGLSQAIGAEIIRLPLLTVTAFSLLFLLYLVSLRLDLPEYDTLRHPKLADAVIFILLALCATLGRASPIGVPDWYYPVVIVTTGVLAIRIVSLPIKLSLHLGQIVLLGLVTRATPWFSYPVYGQDRFHHTAVQYLLATGEVVPESVTYYANFPAAHRFAASYTLLTGTSFKVGYFSLGIIVAISLLGVYLLANTVISNTQGALFAALLVAVSGYHIRAGAEPFAQALFTALVPFILYGIAKGRDKRRYLGLVLLLTGFATTIQNIAPLVLFGVCIAFLGSAPIVQYLGRVRPLGQTITVSGSVIAVIGAVGIYSYIVAGYLRMQTMRVFWLSLSLFGSSNGGQSVVSDTGLSGTPTVSLFGWQFPDILMWAAPILASAGLLVLTTYLLLYLFIQKCNLGPIQYIAVAALIFSIFGVFFAAGSPASRALPSVVVLLAPVGGWTVYRMIDIQPSAGQLVAVILIVVTVMGGILTPPVAKAELSNDDFRAGMTAGEVATVEFAAANIDSGQASLYAAGLERHIIGSQPQMGVEPTLKPTLNNNERKSLQVYTMNANNGTATVYFDYYRTAYEIPPPDTNRVFSAGNASIYT